MGRDGSSGRASQLRVGLAMVYCLISLLVMTATMVGRSALLMGGLLKQGRFGNSIRITFFLSRLVSVFVA